MQMQTAPFRASSILRAPVIRSAVQTFVDALYPPACVGCAEATDEIHGLCADCWRDATFIAGDVCDRCGAPVVDGAEEGDVCDSCLHAPPAFGQGRAAMVYEGAGRRMILSLKHGDRIDLAKPMGRWMLRAAGPLAREADLIAPVPLHWTRLLKRRFNQSAELSREVAELAGAPSAPDLLRRTRQTETQDRKNRAERHDNMDGAFAVRDQWRTRIDGARVLLVDDVMTTGATLSACAEACRAAGAALVFARVAREPWTPIFEATPNGDEDEAEHETG
jgi:ComF family protein